MSRPLVSIGTRAYNAEKTIAQTVESVLSQSMPELEYWVANNGSTDRTGEILEQYAARDKRLHVIHLDVNQPLFSTLGMLVERGQGQYFMLLDSDDWLEPDFVRELYANAVEHQMDVAVGGSRFHFVESGKVGYRKSNVAGAFPKASIPKLFPQIHQFFRPVWGKIFSSEVVKKRWEPMHQARPGWLSYGGDTYTCFELLKGANGFYLSDKVLHNYRVHSASSSYFFSIERFDSDVFLLEHAIEYLSGFGPVSEENLNFVYLVYWNAVLDTLLVLLGSDRTAAEKSEYVARIMAHPHTQYVLDKKYLDASMMLRLTNLLHNQRIGNLESSLEKVCSAIISKSPLLEQCIEKPGFVLAYGNIARLMINGQYSEASAAVIDELANGSEAAETYKTDLLHCLIKLSAVLQQPEPFVLAHKLLVQAYIRMNDAESAVKWLSELKEMVPGDPDVDDFEAALSEHFSRQ